MTTATIAHAVALLLMCANQIGCWQYKQELCCDAQRGSSWRLCFITGNSSMVSAFFTALLLKLSEKMLRIFDLAPTQLNVKPGILSRILEV